MEIRIEGGMVMVSGKGLIVTPTFSRFLNIPTGRSVLLQVTLTTYYLPLTTVSSSSSSSKTEPLLMKRIMRITPMVTAISARLKTGQRVM